MTVKPINPERAAYDVLNGAQALRGLAGELAGHGADTPLTAGERDHLIFVMEMMAERAELCAAHWLDNKKGEAAQA